MSTTLQNKSIIILAGGLGKRMNSDIPKVLHKVLGKPMLVHVIERAIRLNSFENTFSIYIVVGKYEEIIKKTLSEYVNINDIVFGNQTPALGTGHAIQCVMPYLLENQKAVDYKHHNVIILSGDVPLLRYSTLTNLYSNNSPVLLMTSTTDDPTGYGRIVTNENGIFQKIVEEKDCNSDEKKINIVNAGVYSFNVDILCKYLPLLKNNNSQNEYYLTDLFEMIKNGEQLNIDMFHLPQNQNIELTGVNTKEQLEELNRLLQSTKETFD